MKRTAQKFLSVFINIFLIVSFTTFSYADTDQSGGDVAVKFTTSAKIEYTIDFPFSDSLFTGDDSAYSHDLAKASMGLTVASFRQEKKTDAGNYFRKTGFEGIDLSAYETLPSTDSIANCIAHKKIGDFTLIAVGVCGYNYGKEWASNFRIGDEERAVGFNEAAQKVNDRIRNHIEEYGLKGDLKLWVTGMSRAGAVSNIVAADMTDSGLFSQVYGYTFGTPRTTRKPGSYDNIFNIMSKDDIVPKVPLADWGYEHFGVDLYLPSQECDSDWPSKAIRAADEIDSINFRNNPELYGQFREIFSYICELMPTSADYVAGLQDSLISVISMGENDNVFEILQQAAGRMTPETEEQKTELNSFLSYLDVLSSKYILHGNIAQKEEGNWLIGEGIGSNLMVEHTVTTYIPWLLATDSADELYSDNREFIHLMVDTASTVNIVGLQGVIQSIDPAGNKNYRGKTYDDTYLAMSRTGTQVFVDLPLDRPYTVIVTPAGNETVNLMAMKYSIDTVQPEVLSAASYSAEPGEPLMVFSKGGDKGIKIDSGNSVLIKGTTKSISLPMSTITQIENLNIFNLSFTALLRICLIVLAILLAELAASIAVAIARKILRKEKRGRGRMLLFINNIVYLALAEISVWYFAPAIRILNEIIAAITFIFIAVFAAGSHKKLPSISLIAVMLLILLTQYGYAGEITLAGALIVFLRDAVLAAAAIMINKKMETKTQDIL